MLLSPLSPLPFQETTNLSLSLSLSLAAERRSSLPSAAAGGVRACGWLVLWIPFPMDDAVETAAEILVSFQNRRLVRWPEWVPRPDEKGAAAEEKKLPGWKDRRKRTSKSKPPPAILVCGLELRDSGGEKAASIPAPLPPPARKKMLFKMKVKDEPTAARGPETPPEYGAGAGSGANFSRDGVARPLPPRAVVKAEPTPAARMPESPPYYVAAAGSAPSTAGGDRRPRPRPVERAHVKTVLAAAKEAMEASSPETPLDYAATTGSGASSSGDESSRKRKAALGAGGSGGASSSGDEGCSSPEKRPCLVAGGGAQTAAAAKAEVSPPHFFPHLFLALLLLFPFGFRTLELFLVP